MNERIAHKFEFLAGKKRKALVSFVTAGDPNFDSAKDLALFLASQSDILEIGMPFSDPMADGNTLQKSYTRALKNGHKMQETLELARLVRTAYPDLPIILMGYINPILAFGENEFLQKAKGAGVDGLIVVDLPPEEDSTLCDAARNSGLHWIRLITPTTSEERLRRLILPKASGFLYCVSTAGITGTQKPNAASVQQQIETIRKHSSMPVVVGFGIRDYESAKPIAAISDGIVVGSAIAELIESRVNAPSTSIISAAQRVIQNIQQAL